MTVTQDAEQQFQALLADPNESADSAAAPVAIAEGIHLTKAQQRALSKRDLAIIRVRQKRALAVRLQNLQNRSQQQIAQQQGSAQPSLKFARLDTEVRSALM